MPVAYNRHYLFFIPVEWKMQWQDKINAPFFCHDVVLAVKGLN
jgi:hypothetical protein